LPLGNSHLTVAESNVRSRDILVKIPAKPPVEN
jgi:hypothetical protein